jgi:hypothetical protein
MHSPALVRFRTGLSEPPTSATAISEEGTVRSRFAVIAFALALAVFGLSGPLRAQGVTGQLAGTVTDATGGVLPGVTIVVKNVNTQATRETRTGARGEFLFPDLLGGTFDLTASLEGFKTFEQKGVVVASTDRIQLRAISLEVGGLTETVSVQAEAVQVQTTSGARQSLVTRETFDDIALKGRDFAGLLKTLPGVIDTAPRDAPGWESMNNITINGQANFSTRSPKSGSSRRTSTPSTAAARVRRSASSRAAEARNSGAAPRTTGGTTR